MWINANERKPDNARQVFVRGALPVSGETSIAIAAWHDFDDRWSNVIGLLPLDTARTPIIEYWCEINDLLELPIEGEQEQDSKIDVHKIGAIHKKPSS